MRTMRTHSGKRKKQWYRRRNKKNMKDTTNIRIDRELKQLFESTKDLHHKSIGDAAEIGIRTILIELNDSALIEQELKRIELEIQSLSQKIANLKKLREEIGDIRT
jgi:hypothetical protein